MASKDSSSYGEELAGSQGKNCYGAKDGAGEVTGPQTLDTALFIELGFGFALMFSCDSALAFLS